MFEESSLVLDQVEHGGDFHLEQVLMFGFEQVQLLKQECMKGRDFLGRLQGFVVDVKTGKAGVEGGGLGLQGGE